MAPLRNIRRSRRLSRKPPMEAADYDWDDAASLQLLYPESDVEIAPSIPLAPPSPSSCTTSSSDSPPLITTHLPFAPGSSHTRNRKEGHIPRPPNAFMVFRSWLWNKDNLKSVERDNRNVSRIAGRYWNELSEAERAPFRRMAEEAKARHTQLYPDYRYLPSSQKRPKAAHRRARRDSEDENEKCKKLADLLLGGVVGRDLAKYLDEEKKEPQTKRVKEEESVPSSALENSMSSLRASTRKAAKTARAPRKGPYSRPSRSNKKPEAVRPLVPTPLAQFTPLPIPSMTEDWPETAETPGLFIGTPELQYPLLDPEEFVSTDDIPYLDLDRCDNLIARKDRKDVDPPVLPSHLLPGAYSPFCGVKPEAIQFADSCILGAYTTNMQVPPTPLISPYFELESISSCGSTRDPLYSPVYFSNPFESDSTTTCSTVLNPLDQLFGQCISPLTPFIPTETL